MLKSILSIAGVEKISKNLQKNIKSEKTICKQDRMCAEYGKHCQELACKEVPLFEIDLI